MKPETTKYLNATGERIELGIGTRPGVPWTRYDSEPGQIVEGPSAPAYRERFLRAGYTEATAEDVEFARMVAEDKAQADALKTPAVEPQVERGGPELVKGWTEVKPEPTPPAPPPTAAPAPQKGRRGADRGAKG